MAGIVSRKEYQAVPLSDARIRSTKATDVPVKLSDAHGLYIEIKPSGRKFWRYRYRIGGRENVFAFGEFIDSAKDKPNALHISLSAARTMRNEANLLVKKGIHPSHDRKIKVLNTIIDNESTFRAIATEWVEGAKSARKWTPDYCRQIDRAMKMDIFPLVGSLPIRAITPADMLSVLEKIEKRGAKSIAVHVRQWCSAAFRYAICRRKAENDPMVILQGTIRRPAVVHNKPLPIKEIPGFFKALEDKGGSRTTRIAIELLMLTFVRTIELRAATWDEFDLDCSEWRIPAHRMKMRELHIIPLSKQAAVLLKELHTITGQQKWLFPNCRRADGCMAKTTINRSIERMGYGGRFSAHGFRGTASTILNEKGYRPDVIERQLAHSDRNRSRASYNQAEYLPDRKIMMQEWGDFLDSLREKPADD